MILNTGLDQVADLRAETLPPHVSRLTARGRPPNVRRKYSFQGPEHQNRVLGSTGTLQARSKLSLAPGAVLLRRDSNPPLVWAGVPSRANRPWPLLSLNSMLDCEPKEKAAVLKSPGKSSFRSLKLTPLPTSPRTNKDGGAGMQTQPLPASEALSP